MISCDLNVDPSDPKCDINDLFGRFMRDYDSAMNRTFFKTIGPSSFVNFLIRQHKLSCSYDTVHQDTVEQEIKNFTRVFNQIFVDCGFLIKVEQTGRFMLNPQYLKG